MTLDPSITKEKVLSGIHGERRWFTEPFKTSASIDLLSEILDVAIGGGSRTLDQILGGSADAIGIAALFAGLGGLPRRFIEAGGSELLKRLLGNTEVEDPSIASKKGRARASLANDLHFEQAGRGNLAEVIKAAKWVIEVNYGPLGKEIIDSLGALSMTGGEARPDSESLTPSSESAAA